MESEFHRIADVLFQTYCPVGVGGIETGFFQHFTQVPALAGVIQRFHLCANESLTTPALDSRTLQGLYQQQRIYRDTLTIPPVFFFDDNSPQQISCEPEQTLPLLNHEGVQLCLLTALERPEWITITLHRLIVEIFDYQRHCFDIFLHSSLLPLLRSDFCFNGIRRLFSAAFPAFNALIVHSSGIIINGRVALFLAPDEGGKSTVVGLGPAENVLCDDYNVLSHRLGINAAHSTPWGSLCNGPVSSPLGGLFFLEKAADFSLIPMGTHEAVAQIWDENVRFLKNLPRELKKRAFHTLTDICRQTPAYTLHFPKDYIDWQAVDQAMT